MRFCRLARGRIYGGLFEGAALKSIYVAGPMRGHDEFNFPAFHSAAKMLRSQGYHVFNPAERDEQVLGLDTSQMSGEESELEWTNEQFRDVLRADCEAIINSDAIYMLSGWEHSVGARTEHALAVWLRLEILYQ